MRALAISIGIVLTSACGAKTLDIGRSPDTRDGGSPGSDATHSTVLIPHVPEPVALAMEGSFLYWLMLDGEFGEIARCDTRNCAATRQSVVRASRLHGLFVYKETVYFRLVGSIASCPVSGCSVPTVIVARSSFQGLFTVDDSQVHWASGENAFLSCPLTGCETPTAAPATGIGLLLGLGADHLNLYYWSAAFTGDAGESFSIMSAPKDGSAFPKVIAGGLGKLGSFIVDGGFVSWTTLEAKGKIARCPSSGCSGGTPEVLLDEQVYPHHLTHSDGVLFWVNETDPPVRRSAMSRPWKILGCLAANCSQTVEVLDESRGGSVQDPIKASTMPAQQMVADAEALYWIGDFTLDSGSMLIDASIRRLPRKPGK
jgi:hypothetical protein